MKRNLALAPLRNVFFDSPRPTRDSWRFGETPSRFDSVEQDRLSRYLPSGSAGLPPRSEMRRADMTLTHPTYFGEVGTPQTINEINARVHAGAGGSGQINDDSQGMLELAHAARQNRAPVHTPYKLDGSDGRGAQPSENNLNERGDLGMAASVDPSEAFASELNKVPAGQPNAAVNALNRAMSAAKSSQVRDSIEKIWKAWQARR